MTTASPQVPTEAPGSRARGAWHALRFPLAVAAVLLTVSVLASLGSEQFPTGHLEPGSVEPDGTRALVNVLREDREVEVVRSSEAAAEAVSGAGDAVLVLTMDHRLLPEELERLAGLGADTVLVQPGVNTLEAFAPGVEVSGRSDGESLLGGFSGAGLEPHCDLPAAAAAGPVHLDGELYTASAGTGCYPGGTGDALVRVERDGAAITVLGTGTPLVNDALDRAGNAALALNVMDADTVVWLRPDPPQQEGGASPVELLPPGLRWSLLPLLLTLALLALWQGRRLGALVPEALPVVVRASETTEGRAGLYRSRQARDRVASALRSGFLERNVPRLGLGADASPAAVVSALADRTGDAPEELRALLYPGSPDPWTADDEALLRLADGLDERVRRLQR
ncbi:DUF4350 domain-containing protein [Nocardiopsis algeriensis]|uniref:DUF4350 domain-containing protein n=1 Tax=Nocardiopsis algeriensis TaxID=1478215 RepID=A0A841IJ39_9ACTN|nr:DUF4350 domain-containing protein [Nocardiopsis algeriensis]MBB6118757.1 hypothetical protein [Nocardiopsis algeriensis]